MSKEHFEKVVQRMAEGGLLPRGLATELAQQYDYTVADLATEAKPSAEAQAVLDDAAARGLLHSDNGSISFFTGDLTVTGPDDAAAPKAKKSK